MLKMHLLTGHSCGIWLPGCTYSGQETGVIHSEESSSFLFLRFYQKLATEIGQKILYLLEKRKHLTVDEVFDSFLLYNSAIREVTKNLCRFSDNN